MMNFDKIEQQINKQFVQNRSNTNLPNIPEWADLGRVNVIKKWANEIIEGSSMVLSREGWELIGIAVTLIHDDVEHCQKICARVARDISFEFVRVNSNDVESFFSRSINKLDQAFKPTLVYLEPGEWMKSQEDASSQIVDIQKKVQSQIESFDPSEPVLFVTSTSNYSELSADLRKAGYFDRRFIVLKPTLEEVGTNFLKMVGEDNCSKSFKESLGKIGKLLDLEFDDKRRQELIALTLKRIGKKESRKLEFADLVYLSTQGSAESDEYPKRSSEFHRKIAVHEAGHAVVAMIDSAGKNIPEYVSILESENYNGVVADSMSYHLSKHKSRTYADIRHQIRVSLAGRVAEHLVYGSENISIASATDDLRKATELCFYMFSSRGVSNDMESLEGACSNLTIEREEDKPFNLKRTEAIARTYLADQYKIVHETLVRNRILFNSIVDQLMTGAILDQRDLCQITRDITT